MARNNSPNVMCCCKQTQQVLSSLTNRDVVGGQRNEVSFNCAAFVFGKARDQVNFVDVDGNDILDCRC
jgi:hypothetical protein